ncbi:MAG TPA: helix-turn-helix domain-containing protein [Puia sp.]
MKSNETILQILADIRNFMLSRKNIFTVEELSKYSGMSKSTIYKLTFERDIPFYKPGGKLIFFRRNEIDDWILRHQIPPVNHPTILVAKQINKQKVKS